MANTTYNKNNVRPRSNNNRRKTKEEYEAEKAAHIARQNKSLDIIEDVAAYLEDFIINSKLYKVSIKDLLGYLNNEKQHSIEDTKVVSQLTYLLVDLANARKNKAITPRRIDIRILYINERLRTSFKKELHGRIAELFETPKFAHLFANPLEAKE